MFNENIAFVQDNIEKQIQKQFSLINQNLNIISNNIKSLIPSVRDDDAELLDYLNQSMEIVEKNEKGNTVYLEFNNEYNSINNKINKYGYKYNTEKFNESLKLRNKLINAINEDLNIQNVENGINIKNSIYKEINEDIEYFKKKEESIYYSEKEIIQRELNYS